MDLDADIKTIRIKKKNAWSVIPQTTENSSLE
jgi:hypothetical protein